MPKQARLKLPKHVDHFVDRFGRARFYFRRKGGPRTRLPGLPWTPEFMRCYADALTDKVAVDPHDRRALVPGTVSAAVVLYQESASWLGLAANSRKFRKPILEWMRREFGNDRIKKLERKHVQAIVMSKTPGSQKNWSKALRHMMKFCVDHNLIDTNPCTDIAFAKTKDTGGFHPWTEEEAATYEAAYPVGSTERLAMALMAYLGVRVSDAAKLGPHHFKDGVLQNYQPEKGKDTGGLRINIPVHPELARIIKATPVVGARTFLVGPQGKPYTAGWLSTSVSDWCTAAGLPQCSSHGLRKLCLMRLAEAGCTVFEIQSVSGHKNLAEVQRYVEAANRKSMAKTAMDKLISAGKAA